jgi:hypothetical protein
MAIGVEPIDEPEPLVVYAPVEAPLVSRHRDVCRSRRGRGPVRPEPSAQHAGTELAIGPSSPWRKLLTASLVAIVAVLGVTALATSRPGKAALAPSPTTLPARSTPAASSQPLCQGTQRACTGGRGTESYRTVNTPDLVSDCQHLVDIADARGFPTSELVNRIRFWSDPDMVIDLPVDLDPLDLAIRHTRAGPCSALRADAWGAGSD